MLQECGMRKFEAPLEESIPVGAASLESIVCTEELRSHPSCAHDYTKENRALVIVITAFAVNQKLRRHSLEKALELQSQSAVEPKVRPLAHRPTSKAGTLPKEACKSLL
jgi:hypothetical protein